MKICPDPQPSDMQPDLEQHTIGHRGDHVFASVRQEETGMKLDIEDRNIWIGDEDISDLYALLNLRDEHREVLKLILEERAAKVGIDLGE